MQRCPALSPRELRLALCHLRGRHRFRDRALVLLGVFTGMRISELLSLRVSQVSDGNAIHTRFYLARSATKGKRQGVCLVLHPRAAKALAKWLTRRGPVEPTAWLFPSQRCPDQPLGRRAA